MKISARAVASRNSDPNEQGDGGWDDNTSFKEKLCFAIISMLCLVSFSDVPNAKGGAVRGTSGAERIFFIATKRGDCPLFCSRFTSPPLWFTTVEMIFGFSSFPVLIQREGCFIW